MLTGMKWMWRTLGWLLFVLVAVLVGFSVGGATFSCPEDAADCDLGAVNAAVGALVGLLVAVAVVAAFELPSFAGRRRELQERLQRGNPEANDARDNKQY